MNDEKKKLDDFKTIEVEIQSSIGIIWLNRPEVRNAFNGQMINDLILALDSLENETSVRVVVIGARGNVFCSGADLNHMKRMANYGHQENLVDSIQLAELLFRLHRLSKPTIARFHGHAFAGGMGIISACDIAVASFDAQFCLSEVKLGLVPATIGPYVVNAIGYRAARRYMLSAEKFTAAEAYRVGLLHEIAPMEKLDVKLDSILSSLVQNGPKSMDECKKLIESVHARPISKSMANETAETIARIRSSPEGKEGINSFLEKRPPSWQELG